MTTVRTRSHPASTASAVRPHAATGRVGTRLPWWGAVLPVLAFALLLVLLLGGPEAGAAEPAGSAGGDLVMAVLERLGDALRG